MSTNIKKLLNDSNESFYWVGFLLADGYFTTRNGIKCTLSVKDAGHLQTLSEYINCMFHIKINYCYIDVSNKLVVHLIVDKFDIHHRKTYNPPSVDKLSQFTDEQILSLIVGFIDGDGCIKTLHKRKDFQLRIKCHGSWLMLLHYFGSILSPKYNCRINKSKYAELYITNTTELKKNKNEDYVFKDSIYEQKMGCY